MKRPTAFFASSWMICACTSGGGREPSSPDAAADGHADVARDAGDNDDAASEVAVTVNGDIEWTPALEVRRADLVVIDATGEITSDTADGARVACAAPLSLIGRIDGGTPFELGATTVFGATETGLLDLGVNDTTLEDNAGALSVHVRRSPGGVPAVADGVTVPGTTAWTDTGVDVDGEVLTILGSGTVDNNVSDDIESNPDGLPGTTNGNSSVLKCALHAALLGRIGDGDPFLVGSYYSRQATAAGRLHLGINDSILTDNGGKYSAAIILAPRP